MKKLAIKHHIREDQLLIAVVSFLIEWHYSGLADL
jgi:hypothetical protein